MRVWAYLESLERRVRNGTFKPSHIPSEEDERRAQERASSGQILRRADRRDFQIHEFKGVPKIDARGNIIGEPYDGTSVTTESNWKNNARLAETWQKMGLNLNLKTL